MTYTSTRGAQGRLSAAEAIIKGIADDDGLFVPEQIPKMSQSITELVGLDYKAHVHHCVAPYFTDFTPEELQRCIDDAYNTGFDTPLIAPLVNMSPRLWFLELFHGKTLAFKDMALSILPHLMATAAAKLANGGNRLTQVVLAATSGDTGKAALEGFKDAEGVRVIVFYPEDGVSVLQKRLMTTQEGGNLSVVGIKGNFDDAQSEVKRIFSDRQLGKDLKARGFALSSANSINVGRFIPQIAYYFYAYSQLIRSGLTVGEEVSFVVPTGNFGNILAGYYAKQMGLPIRKLICASNSNNVLCDFFRTGVYDINRDFFPTISPSMDILISSNFERLAFDMLGKSSVALKDRTAQLASRGCYSLEATTQDFVAFYATEQETTQAIHRVYHKYGYIIDPHTAVAYCAYEKYDGNEPTVILSTASPYKFTKTVMGALNDKYLSFNDFELIGHLAELIGKPAPLQLGGIVEKPVLHHTVIETSKMKNAILSILGLKL